MSTAALSKCPRCGELEIETVLAKDEVTCKDGKRLSYADVHSRCKACNFEFYTKKQSLEHSRARAAVLREVDGLRTPAAIKHLREVFGLTQAELERVVGAGPKTCVRWEKGTVAQSAVVDALLWIAEQFPEVFWRLAEKRGVHRKPVAHAVFSSYFTGAVASLAAETLFALAPEAMMQDVYVLDPPLADAVRASEAGLGHYALGDKETFVAYSTQGIVGHTTRGRLKNVEIYSTSVPNSKTLVKR